VVLNLEKKIIRINYFYRTAAIVATLPAIVATFVATFPTFLMAGTSFLESQLLASGDSDEKDSLVFSRGITLSEKIIL
jgi:hypothetical protein